jgi:hypothetical protein
MQGRLIDDQAAFLLARHRVTTDGSADWVCSNEHCAGARGDLLDHVHAQGTPETGHMPTASAMAPPCRRAVALLSRQTQRSGQPFYNKSTVIKNP